MSERLAVKQSILPGLNTNKPKLLMRIAATESVSLCVRMKKLTAFYGTRIGDSRGH
jgi:hypothetical protein